MPQFKVGDRVTWGGAPVEPARYEKTGEVIAVIPAGGSPYRIAERLDDAEFNVHPLRSGGGGVRGHVSYLVAVPTKTGRGKLRVYWPLVSKLKAAQ